MKATSEAHPTEDRGVLHCSAIGSVDDGKSTLLGRLMLDCAALMSDQLTHVEEASRRRGFGRVELALLTDGLRAEREQGITIDVAWRYFSTKARAFVLADAPGHEQYTRNMLTGASVSDAILLLIDARRGPTAQTRRHIALACLLGVPSVLVCINKMDEVGFDQGRYEALTRDVRAMFEPFGARSITFAPVAALEGDNIVNRSARMNFYQGPTVLEWLEKVAHPDESRGGAVFPVQWVIRPQSDAYRDYRGLAGRIVRGELTVGSEIVVLPTEKTARVTSIEHAGKRVDSAKANASVVVHLDRDLDVSRGNVVADASAERPRVGAQHLADLFWLSDTAPRIGARYLVKHQAMRTLARLGSITNSLDITTLSRTPNATLVANDVGRVELKTASPLVWAPYEEHRTLGSFILVDETSGDTVGAGLLREGT